MAHPETNPNFSLSSGNTLDQPGPRLPRAARRYMPRFAPEQYNEPNNMFGTPDRVVEPRSRIIDEPKPWFKPTPYLEMDHYPIPPQAQLDRVIDPRSQGTQPEPNHYPIRSQAPPGRVMDPRSRAAQPETNEFPAHPQGTTGWGADLHTRDPNEPASRHNPPLSYSQSDHYPIHGGQRQGFPPSRSELPRPKRGKSRSKIQWVKQPDPHTQPASDHTSRLDQTNHPTPLLMQRPQKTKILTWCIAVFCAIFWIVIILGGLIVLVVYLIFRPHIPHFDITAGTLNAAYLDMDRLNADLSLLVNFTNPNRKVSVDFSYVILDLYYGGIPIATQYIEPFSAVRSETKLKSVEMITSQVYLPLAARQKLRAQMESNGLVIFDVKGIFRARSNLGSLLRYSYPLYSHCSIYLTGPPTGVLRGRRCKTKR